MKHSKKIKRIVDRILSVTCVTIKFAVFAVYDTFECSYCTAVFVCTTLDLVYCCHVSRSIDGLFKYTDNGQRKGLVRRFIKAGGFFFLGTALFDLRTRVTRTTQPIDKKINIFYHVPQITIIKMFTIRVFNVFF